jgi:hypothetical protein
LRISLIFAAVVGTVLNLIGGERPARLFVFTAAPQYDPAAEAKGLPRFPRGATVNVVTSAGKRPIAPAFFASADPEISFDGVRILFAGKAAVQSPWEIWEVAATGGTPRAVIHCQTDCSHPLYLPDGRVAYTRASAAGSDLEVDGQRLTFAPGRHIAQDVLRDGRILYERDGELFTVYPDGTGVESLRCDHGPRRTGARQTASGDVVFGVGGRLARFTSALAAQTDVAQPRGESLGPVADLSTGQWIVALRTGRRLFGLYLWTQEGARVEPLEVPDGMNAIQPAILAPRTPPKQFPSALVETRKDGNLLCLDARLSKDPIREAIAAVQVYTRDSSGAPVLLGRQNVAGDGSFYVQVPADRPLRIEVVDAAGRTVRAERDWFWMRLSEQRICVGCHTGPERSPENKVPEVLLRSILPEKLQGASK